MSRSYNTSEWFKVEPLTKVDRQLAAKAERRSVKVQLATGSEDPFWFKATGHSDVVLNWVQVGSWFNDPNLAIEARRK